MSPIARVWQSQADWDDGTLSNLIDAAALSLPTPNSYPLNGGSLGGSALMSSNTITLPAGTTNGESVPSSGSDGIIQLGQGHTNTSLGVATPIDPARFGNILSSFTIKVAGGYQIGGSLLAPSQYRVQIMAGPVSNLESIQFNGPGTVVWDSGVLTAPAAGVGGANYTLYPATFNPNLTVTPGTLYWIVVYGESSSVYLLVDGNIGTGDYGGIASGINSYAYDWLGGGLYEWLGNNEIAFSYTVENVSTESGTWNSGIYDSQCSSETPQMYLSLSGSYPSGSNCNILVQGSSNGGSWTTTDTLFNPNGVIALAGGSYRYWKLIYQISTSDNIAVPIMGEANLSFSLNGLWTSEVHNWGVRPGTFLPLLGTQTLNGGSTAFFTRTSDDGIHWDAYQQVALGSTPISVVRQYVQVQVAFNGGGGNPVLSRLTLQVNFKSSGFIMFFD